MRLNEISKLIFTFILAISVLLGGQVLVFADEATSTTDADLILPPEEIEEVSLKDLPIYYGESSATYDNLDDVVQAMKETMEKFEPEMTYTYTGNVKEFRNNVYKLMKQMYMTAGNDYIHGTYAGGSYSYKSSSSGTGIDVKMRFKYHGTPAQEEFVTKRIKEIARELTKQNMTDIEKVAAVNDYVVNNTVYSKKPKTSPHNAYALLNEGKAVCQAYALVTYRLLTEMGMEARYVVGSAGGPHAWNSVKVDGVWYHLDTTWNDSGNGVRYSYFLVTTKQLQKDHSWKVADFPVATDSRYLPLHKIYKGSLIGNDVYYVNTADNFKIYKINVQTLQEEVVINKSVSSTSAIIAENEYIYYVDILNNKSLTAYNLISKQSEVIAENVTATLTKKDGNLEYKIGKKSYSYEIPLSAADQEVRTVELAILVLSETSSKADLDAAQKLYDDLSAEQKESVKNLSSLQALQQIYPENLKVATEFETQFPTTTSDTTRVKMKSVVSSYDTLTDGQQALVPSKETITQFKALLAEQDSKIAAVEKALKKLSAKSKKYVTDIMSIADSYNVLGEELQAEVSNYGNFATLLSQAKATLAVVEQIKQLDGNSAAKIVEARKAYTNLPKTFKSYVTNLKTLTAHEKKLKNEIAAYKAIELIDVNSSKLVAQVKAAKKAYTKAGLKKEVVTNAEVLTSVVDQIDVYEQINKLKPSSAKYIAEVTAAKLAYDKLSDNTYVTNSDKLTAALQAIEKAQTVVQKISTVSNDSAEIVIEARNAYDALDKQSKKYVSNLKTLTAKEKRLKNVLAAIKQISAIDPTSSKFVAQVKAAQKAYDKAGNLKGSVYNADILETALPQAVVVEKINSLKSSSTKYIAEVLAAKELYDKLSNKDLVSNVAKLQDALTAIEPAQAVVAEIDALLEAYSIATVTAAREQYKALDKAAKKYVTNEKALKTYENKIKAAVNVVKLIDEVKALDESASNYVKKAAAMKKSYNALSVDNQSLVTNNADYTKFVSLYEIKNAVATKKWEAVTVETFKNLAIENVTEDNFNTVVVGFSSLPKGTGATTVAEITTNVASFIEAETKE